MLKAKKRLFGGLLTLAMVFSLGAGPALAANPGDYLGGTAIPPTSAPESSTYEVTQPADSSAITVTFVIEAGDAVKNYAVTPNTAFREELDVDLTASPAGTFTVADLLYEVDNIRDDLDFNFIVGSNPPSSVYLNAVSYGIKPNQVTWTAGQWGLDGWVFRVNDKFPVQKTADGLGYEGTGVGQTYLNDGDIVHLFYDFPSEFYPGGGSVAADYVRGVYDSLTATGLKVQLQGHDTYIQPVSPYVMSVNNYVDLGAGVAADLYVYNESEEEWQLDKSATSDSDGFVEFDGAFASGQTYLLKTGATYNNNTGWGSMADGAYFILTGAYNKITIP